MHLVRGSAHGCGSVGIAATYVAAVNAPMELGTVPAIRKWSVSRPMTCWLPVPVQVTPDQAAVHGSPVGHPNCQCTNTRW